MLIFGRSDAAVMMAVHMPPAVRWAVSRNGRVQGRSIALGVGRPLNVKAELFAAFDLNDTGIVDQDFDRSIFNILYGLQNMAFNLAYAIINSVCLAHE